MGITNWFTKSITPNGRGAGRKENVKWCVTRADSLAKVLPAREEHNNE